MRRSSGPRHHCAGQRETDEDEIAPAPETPLESQRKRRLNHDRVQQQREQAPQIARGIQKVRIAGGRMVGRREPLLQHRRGRRQHKEWKTDERHEREEEPGHGVGVTCRCRHEPRPEWKDSARGHEKKRISHGVALRAERGGAMRVAVPGQQGHLEKDHARVPDHRRAAEQRQDHLRHHRLEQKHQKRAEEQRGAKEPDERMRHRALAEADLRRLHDAISRRLQEKIFHGDALKTWGEIDVTTEETAEYCASRGRRRN